MQTIGNLEKQENARYFFTQRDFNVLQKCIVDDMLSLLLHQPKSLPMPLDADNTIGLMAPLLGWELCDGQRHFVQALILPARLC